MKDKHGRKIGEEYKTVGVSEAVKILSVGNGQGFLKYGCKSKCATEKMCM